MGMVLFQVKVICTDNESVCMVFFNCVVAKICWSYLNDIFLIDLGSNFEPMARWWVSNNRYKVMNCCSAALMWCLWKTRNEMCFQGKKWLDKKVVIRKMVNTLKNWRILFKDGDLAMLDHVLESLYNKLQQPLLLGMSSQQSNSLVATVSSSAPSAGMATSRSVQLTIPLHDVAVTAEQMVDVIGSCHDDRIFEPP